MKDGLSTSDRVLGNFAILAIACGHIGSDCKGGRACRPVRQDEYEPLQLEPGNTEGLSVIAMQLSVERETFGRQVGLAKSG